MEQLHQVKANLEKRGFSTHLVQTQQEALEYLLAAIEPNQVVAAGGSATLKDMEIDKALTKRGNRFVSHWDPTLTPEEKRQALLASFQANVYLSSVNALTMDGRLINVDGHGNRVAATLYGPEKVIFVIGKNKLAEDYDSAMHRIKTVSCPANARRLGRKTPCATLGYCTDCSSPDRMCCGTVILERPLSSHPTEVLLVNEDLGY